MVQRRVVIRNIEYMLVDPPGKNHDFPVRFLKNRVFGSTKIDFLFKLN